MKSVDLREGLGEEGQELEALEIPHPPARKD